MMKQVDKEERRRSKQQAPSLFSRPPSKPSSATTTPVLPRYLPAHCYPPLLPHATLHRTPTSEKTLGIHHAPEGFSVGCLNIQQPSLIVSIPF